MQKHIPGDETLLHMRVPAEVLTRGDRLRPLLQQKAELRSVRVTRAAVLRMALERGLAVLEAETSADGARVGSASVASKRRR